MFYVYSGASDASRLQGQECNIHDIPVAFSMDHEYMIYPWIFHKTPGIIIYPWTTCILYPWCCKSGIDIVYTEFDKQTIIFYDFSSQNIGIF